MRHSHGAATLHFADNQKSAIGMDMLSFCDDIPPTDSDETTSGARTSSRSPSTAIDTFSETETTSPPTTITGENGSGGSDQSSESSESPVSGGLSTGAKAGIGIGAALGVILLLLGAFLLGRRRRQRKDSVPTTVLDSNHHEKKGLEMEGEKWIPELDAQKNQIPAELECPSTR